MTLRVNPLVAPSRDVVAQALAAEGIATEPSPHLPWGLRVTSGAIAASDALARGQCMIQDEGSQTRRALGTGDRRRPSAGCLRRTRRQDAHLRRRQRRPDRGRRRPAGAGGAARRDVAARPCRSRPHRASRSRRGAALRRRPSTSSSSTPRAAVSARCGAIPTSSGGAPPRTSAASPTVSSTWCFAPPPRCARAGALVYTTCSTEPEENEQVVARAMARLPEFRPAVASGAAGRGRAVPLEPTGCSGPTRRSTASTATSASSSNVPGARWRPASPCNTVIDRAWPYGGG